MRPPDLFDGTRSISRRCLLERAGCGFGLVALRSLVAAQEAASPSGGRVVEPAPGPHFAPRAKRILFLFMQGGPSHMDTFDPKPLLTRDHGKPLPFKRPLTFAEGSVGNLFR
ncbi:MAG: DUF1501 domain-containing protein, partial [Acidobacteria bacterium]|nr:DUF1501 domain-containing protein [Acidobacteriota bacterium]